MMDSPVPSKSTKRIRITESQEEYHPRSKRTRTSKRTPAASASSRTTRKKKADKKKQIAKAPLLDLPAEMLNEILSYLPMKDLLTLSGLCKDFRAFLTDNSDYSRKVWSSSRQYELVPVPDPPEGVAEEQWARFLYGSTCQLCGAKVKLIHIYSLQRRVCKKCMTKNVVRGRDQPTRFAKRLPFASLSVLPLIPSTHKDLGSGSWERRFQPRGSSGYYWISDITKMSKLLARDYPEVFFSEKMAAESPEYQRFYDTKVSYVRGVMKHSETCCRWEVKMREKIEKVEKVRRMELGLSAHEKVQSTGPFGLIGDESDYDYDEDL